MSDQPEQIEQTSIICCDAIYWCNNPPEGMECAVHGGFDVCCDNPEEHYPAFLFRCTMCQAPTLSTTDHPTVQPCWQCGGLSRLERQLRGE